MFVLIEIIELNFLGLNQNLKKNIILRSRREANSIFQIEEEDSVTESELSLDKEEDNNEDNNSVYD